MNVFKCNLLLSILTFVLSCTQRPVHNISQCEFNQKIPSMGSFFEIQFSNLCDKEFGDALVVKIKNQLESLESEMSLYQKQSALSRLNQIGQVNEVSFHFIRNLELAIENHQKTEGYFNITILPILESIQRSFKNTKRPPKNLARFKSLLDVKKIKITDKSVAFEQKNMKITLDGIAKGYAVDLIADELEAQGVNSYLLNFSGNMKWLGRRPDGNMWKIAVWDFENKTIIEVPASDSGAIASSGAEHNFISEDRLWHHIINPKTLKPPNHISVASVVGPSALICDILSTTLFILPDKDRKRILATQYPEYKYWVMHRNGISETTIF